MSRSPLPRPMVFAAGISLATVFAVLALSACTAETSLEDAATTTSSVVAKNPVDTGDASRAADFDEPDVAANLTLGFSEQGAEPPVTDPDEGPPIDPEDVDATITDDQIGLSEPETCFRLQLVLDAVADGDVSGADDQLDALAASADQVTDPDLAAALAALATGGDTDQLVAHADTIFERCQETGYER